MQMCSPEVEGGEVVDLDRVRLPDIKFIEAVPTEGIPSDSFSNQIKSLPLYQPDSSNMDGYKSF